MFKVAGLEWDHDIVEEVINVVVVTESNEVLGDTLRHGAMLFIAGYHHAVVNTYDTTILATNPVELVGEDVYKVTRCVPEGYVTLQDGSQVYVTHYDIA